MTMAIDQQQRQFGALNFDHLPSYSHFTNPWNQPSAAQPQQPLYPTTSHSLHQNMGMDIKQEPPRMSHNLPAMSSYQQIPHSAAPTSSSMPSAYGQSDMMMNQSRLQPTTAAYSNGVSYTSAGPAHSTYSTSSPFDNANYATAPLRQTYPMQPSTYQDTARRLSQPSVSSSYLPVNLGAHRHHRQRSLIDMDHRAINAANNSRDFGDVIDASRGMIAMSQNTTPRNIYGPAAGRTNGESYGFPQTHSSRSSISSTSTYPTYFAGSIDSSVSDYSNTGSDIESVSSRTLPRPSGFMTNGQPPAPSSMMGQFSSKVSSSAQKKHKCKVCDKRFTRPSSLQTHMYSHTGEKPFACDVEGCGRHFSVVSNLRRHKKVHKGENQSEAGSDDHHSDD